MSIVPASNGKFFIYPSNPNRKHTTYPISEELYQRYLELNKALDELSLQVNYIINETDASAVD